MTHHGATQRRGDDHSGRAWIMLKELQVRLLSSPAGPLLAFLQVRAQFRCLLLTKQIQRRVVEPRVFAPGQQEVRLQAYMRDESDTHERACGRSKRR